MRIEAPRLSGPTPIGAEFGADDDAAIGPAAAETPRQRPGQRESITARAECLHCERLLRTPVRPSLAGVLELQGESAQLAADPQQAGRRVPVLDAVVAQLAGHQRRRSRILKPCRLREIAHALPR